MKKAFGILLLVLFVCTSCGDKSEPSFKVYDEYSKEKKVEKKNNIGKATYISVSYTHLTLPTICSV